MLYAAIDIHKHAFRDAICSEGSSTSTKPPA